MEAQRVSRRIEGTERAAGSTPGRDVSRALRQLQKELEAQERLVAYEYTRAQALLSTALATWPENARARRALGELYLERFLKADQERNAADGIFYAGLIEQVNDGHFDRVLKGNGSLLVTSVPPGAAMRLLAYRDEDGILVPGEEAARGEGQIEVADLPMGSYLLLLEREGHETTRFPIFVRRNEEIRAEVRLCPRGALPPGFVHVPAGPFLRYGDPSVISTIKDTSIEHVGDFAIGVHPITCGEYLAFLNALLRSSPDEALARSPRQSETSGYLWSIEEGEFRLPRDRQRYPWQKRLPVFGISFEDALAYAKHRSAAEGRAYDLPTEAEWEKAAKGVDGRFFSWGNVFDASYCNNFYARPDDARGVAETDSFPEDCSPYGVRGMVGNVGDWCWFDGPSREGIASVRGGNWALSGDPCRLAYRRSTTRTYVSDRFGFRLKLALEGVLAGAPRELGLEERA